MARGRYNYSDIAEKEVFGTTKNKTQKNSSSRRHEPIYNLRISETEKYAHDCEWFKEYAEYIVPAYSSVIDNYREMKTSYEVINNNLNGFKDELQRFCNPLGENIGQIEEEVIPYAELHNKVNVFTGELIQRNDDYQVVLLTAQAIQDKNQSMIDELKASVTQELQIEIEKVEMELQGLSQEQIQQYIEQKREHLTPKDILDKNWMSEAEIFYNKGVKYCYFDQQVKSKKLETFQDVITADRCFVYSGWRFGKPFLEVRNPLFCGFHKAPNQKFVNKGDYFWYKKPVTVADVYHNYGDKLSQEEIESLGIHTYANNQRVDRRHSLDPRYNDLVFDHTTEEIYTEAFQAGKGDYQDKQTGTHQGQGISTRYNKENLIWETHIEFKAFRHVIFLDYTNEYNKKVTVVVSDKFDIPKSAKKTKFVNRYGNESEKWVWYDKDSETEYSAEKIWIPRKYEVIRLGSDIYPICREVPYQQTNIESPYSSFNLSTFGGIFTSRNADSISLLQRAIPPYFQYIYVKHIQNRELSKYQGAIQSIDIDQIPDKLGKDIYGNQIRDKIATYLYYLKRTNKDFYSGSQSSLGALPPATRSPGSSGFMLGTAVELLNLQQLLEFISQEIGMAMGISPQREAQFTQGTNVSDNQQAIAQSHHITEPYFYLHDEIWKQAINDYLLNFRSYCDRIFSQSPQLAEHSFHYILPDGTQELLKVTPDMLRHTDIGLYVSNNTQHQKYLDIMLQLTHAFAQNAGEGMEAVSAIVKGITSGVSSEEVHKMIQIESKKQQERMMQMEQVKQQSQQQMAQAANQVREDEQQHEFDMQERKYYHEKEMAAMETYKFQQTLDMDNDGVPDPIEIMKMGHDADIKAKELAFKEKELETKERIETKKIQAQKNKPASK